MARRYYQLPSLTSLNTFDACARHGSFTAAAGELGVTLGAVSRQVKALELELNCPLFKRRHRGVELTAEGLDLFQVLSGSFRQIGRLCQALRTRAEGRDVTLAATTAFASLWLMPRLGGFWQRHRDVNLNHAISDNPQDPGFVNADMRIRYGDGHWRGEAVRHLFDDRIYPVCGRGFAAQHEPGSFEDLPDLPLLRLDNVDPAWTGWDAWLESREQDAARLNYRRFNNYVVEPLIRRGRLVRIGEHEISAPGSYYLAWDESRPLSEAALSLRDWLLEAGREQQALNRGEDDDAAGG